MDTTKGIPVISSHPVHSYAEYSIFQPNLQLSNQFFNLEIHLNHRIICRNLKDPGSESDIPVEFNDLVLENRELFIFEQNIKCKKLEFLFCFSKYFHLINSTSRMSCQTRRKFALQAPIHYTLLTLFIISLTYHLSYIH